jgi:hypothetical protein
MSQSLGDSSYMVQIVVVSGDILSSPPYSWSWTASLALPVRFPPGADRFSGFASH